MAISNENEMKTTSAGDNNTSQNGESLAEKEKVAQWREIVLKTLGEAERKNIPAKKNKSNKSKDQSSVSALPKKNASQPAVKINEVTAIQKIESEKNKIFEKKTAPSASSRSVGLTAKKLAKRLSTKVNPKLIKDSAIPPPEFTQIKKLSLAKRLVKFFLILLLYLVFLTLVVVIFFGIGLYKYQWNDKLTNQIIKIVPYPVAIVNGQILPYSEFRDNVLALTRYYKKQEEVSRGVKMMPSPEKIKEDILRVMITNELMKQLAAKAKINLSSQELDKKLQEISLNAPGKVKVQEIIKDLYGWDIGTYKERILRPSLLSEKLDSYFLTLQTKNLNEVLKEFQAQAEIRRFFY